MRLRIAALLMGPVIRLLSLMLRSAAWLQLRMTGIVPVTPEEKRATGDTFYDFESEWGFSELMEADWFLNAIRSISRTEVFRLAGAIRDRVSQREFEEAARMEAAATVFEDLESILRGYADLYEAARKTEKKPR